MGLLEFDSQAALLHGDVNLFCMAESHLVTSTSRPFCMNGSIVWRCIAIAGVATIICRLVVLYQWDVCGSFTNEQPHAESKTSRVSIIGMTRC